MQNHVIEVNVAALQGEYPAVWLIKTWTYHGSLSSPHLQKRTESLNSTSV